MIRSARADCASPAQAALAGRPPRRHRAPGPRQRRRGPTTRPRLAIGCAGGALARKVDLSIGRSLIVDLPRDAKEVFVANPKVANAVVCSTRKVFVIGMENGATSIFVMDAEGRQIAALEVNVGRDLNVLQQTLRTAIPQAQIQIRPAGDSVLLTGRSRPRPRPSRRSTSPTRSSAFPAPAASSPRAR